MPSRLRGTSARHSGRPEFIVYSEMEGVETPPLAPP